MLDRMNKTVVDNDLLDEHEAERDRLHAMLGKFLAWDKKWPNTAAVMEPSKIIDAEIELDDLMQEAAKLIAEART